MTMNQINTMSQQVLSNYDTYFSSAIVVSDNVQVYVDNLDFKNKNNQTSTRNYFDTIISFKEEINNMSLYGLDGSLLTGDSKDQTSANVTDSEWFKNALYNPLINVFSRVDNDAGNYVFTLSKFLNTNKGFDNAIVKIDFSFAKIIDLIASTDLGDGGHITIFDNNYGVVYSSSDTINHSEIEQVKSLVMGIKQVSLDHEYVLFASTIQSTSWRVAIFTNNEAMSKALISFITVLSVLSLVIIGVFSIIMILVANSITSPIRELQYKMQKIESLNYVVNSEKEISGSKEVQDLSRNFNLMMERIKELTEKVIDEQEEQRKSELKALQNQINPHFLYNTFDSVIYMIDKGENDKAEEMIVALSKFFRISVSKGHNIIPLEKEIEHAKYYLTIQKLRFGDSFEYEFNIDPKLYKYFVIKLILQPIIENAIGHGLKDSTTDKGKITINGHFEGDLIALEVVDNGYGILPEKVAELYESFTDRSIHTGVGLKNVYERIRIYYGEKADIKIDSQLDVGTKITILIPIEGAINDEEE